jgi:hypothetical protein
VDALPAASNPVMVNQRLDRNLRFAVRNSLAA